MLKIFFYGLKKCTCRIRFKQIKNFLTLLEKSLMYGGRLLKILIPIQCTPPWYIVRLVMGW
jgi:hypothetical protein